MQSRIENKHVIVFENKFNNENICLIVNNKLEKDEMKIFNISIICFSTRTHNMCDASTIVANVTQ